MMDIKEYLIDNLGFIVIYLFLIIFISMTAGKKAVVGVLGLTLFVMIMTNINILYPATLKLTK